MKQKLLQLFALAALLLSTISFTTCTKYQYDKPTTPPITYTLTFHANGGSKAPEAIIVIKSEAITLFAQGDMTPPEGKPTFLGWHTNKDAYSARYTAGDDYTPTEDVTLYAIWSSKMIRTITFNVNDGSGLAPDSISLEEGKSVWLPKQGKMIEPKDKHIFDGWSEDPMATSGIEGNYTPKKSLTLYAIWYQSRPQAIESLRDKPLKDFEDKYLGSYKIAEQTDNYTSYVESIPEYTDISSSWTVYHDDQVSKTIKSIEYHTTSKEPNDAFIKAVLIARLENMQAYVYKLNYADFNGIVNEEEPVSKKEQFQPLFNAAKSNNSLSYALIQTLTGSNPTIESSLEFKTQSKSNYYTFTLRGGIVGANKPNNK
ncbi:MAG: InlB B-repeat-containing protein [Bacteroidales bacterium]